MKTVILTTDRIPGALSHPLARGLRVGQHRRKNADQVKTILNTVQAQWEIDPNVPLSNGDSWTSWTKRMRRLGRLITASSESLIIQLDAASQAILMSLMAGQVPSPALADLYGRESTKRGQF